MDPETRGEIQKVEQVLEDIRANTSLPLWRVALNGILYGGGIAVGTVLAIALLGWLLSIFGIIPGFGEIAVKLQEILNAKF
jgi:uncharacterized membrane protein YczE